MSAPDPEEAAAEDSRQGLQTACNQKENVEKVTCKLEVLNSKQINTLTRLNLVLFAASCIYAIEAQKARTEHQAFENLLTSHKGRRLKRIFPNPAEGYDSSAGTVSGTKSKYSRQALLS